MPSITALYKSIQSFADKLVNDHGFDCEVNKIPSWNDYRYGSPSHVILYIRKSDRLIARFKFIANGYCGHGNFEFGGDSITDMKNSAMEIIHKKLGDK